MRPTLGAFWPLDSGEEVAAPPSCFLCAPIHSSCAEACDAVVRPLISTVFSYLGAAWLILVSFSDFCAVLGQLLFFEGCFVLPAKSCSTEVMGVGQFYIGICKQQLKPHPPGRC